MLCTLLAWIDSSLLLSVAPPDAPSQQVLGVIEEVFSAEATQKLRELETQAVAAAQQAAAAAAQQASAEGAAAAGKEEGGAKKVKGAKAAKAAEARAAVEEEAAVIQAAAADQTGEAVASDFLQVCVFACWLAFACCSACLLALFFFAASPLQTAALLPSAAGLLPSSVWPAAHLSPALSQPTRRLLPLPPPPAHSACRRATAPTLRPSPASCSPAPSSPPRPRPSRQSLMRRPPQRLHPAPRPRRLLLQTRWRGRRRCWGSSWM